MFHRYVSIGPAFGVGVSANILANAQGLSKQLALAASSAQLRCRFGDSFVGGGRGNRSSKQVSVRLVPAEAHYAASCYDIRESHKPLCR